MFIQWFRFFPSEPGKTILRDNFSIITCRRTYTEQGELEEVALTREQVIFFRKKSDQ